MLEEDVHASQGAFMNQVQQCFAVRNGQDGLLDLARETFQRLSEEIHSLLPQYRDTFDLPSLQVGGQPSRASSGKQCSSSVMEHLHMPSLLGRSFTYRQESTISGTHKPCRGKLGRELQVLVPQTEQSRRSETSCLMICPKFGRSNAEAWGSSFTRRMVLML